ncbi:MAG: substrate-binding domain-containing protein [Chthoniobacteraceae bacterium]
MRSKLALRVCALLFATLAIAHAEPLRVLGSSTVAQAVIPATEEILKDTGADLAFETSVGSNFAINAVSNGRVDLAMSTRAVTSEDRSANPAFSLFDIEIGVQVIVPIVSQATWQAGLRSVSKDDLIKLYEGALPTWEKAGGPALRAVFLNPSDGRGVWEPFVTWLYGDLHRVGPGRRWKTVRTNEEARDLVASTPGALSVVPPKWADGQRVIALPIRDEKGALIEPTEQNFRARKWPVPLVRPLMLIAGTKPSGPLRKMIEFMVSAKGQAFVEAADFLPRPEAAEEMAARFR